MVWKTTQSAFYRAVDSFNNGEKTCEFRDVPRKEKGGRERGCHSPEKRPQKHSENRCEDHRRNEHDPRPNGQCSRGCPCCRAYRRQSSPLSGLLSDNDMLLIAGLILILMRQNADQKLILALAFVLLT